jgi:hypothetical protein
MSRRADLLRKSGVAIRIAFQEDERSSGQLAGL